MHPAAAPQGDAHIPIDTDRLVGGSRLLGGLRDLIRREECEQWGFTITHVQDCKTCPSAPS